MGVQNMSFAVLFFLIFLGLLLPMQ